MEQLIANRYEVLSLLGEGGMGKVYRVKDTLVAGDDLALKTIKVNDAITTDMRLRFKEEFRAMVRLKHPNTIAVHDFGQLDDRSHYITMELVPGRELVDLMDGRAMALSEVYPLLIQLLQALGFVHSRLFVHRDIKAQNIRVRDDGTLKLMDFGLMGQLGLPSSRQVTGTPGYMAPEVAMGGLIDASSDLYSVGCLAYEMITGRLPFEGGLMEVVRAHLTKPPEPLRRLRPDAPERLERIVMKLLEKEQTKRYRQADEVIEDLAALAGVQVSRANLDQQRSYLTSSVLVGRDDELRALGDALRDAYKGRGGGIFVASPAGNGKSRLVQEVVLQAKLSEILVLHGECMENGMAPYEALANALRPGIAHATQEEREQYGPAVARLFPEMMEGKGEDYADNDADLNEVVLSWLQALSQRMPVLWLMDDLHWADPQTLDVFNHCIRHLGADRVLCMGTFRNEEVTTGSPVWYTIQEGVSRAFTLGPLSRHYQLELLKAMLQDIRISEDFFKALYAATAGNAFFLTEVVRGLMEDGQLTRRDGIWHFPDHPDALTSLTRIEDAVERRLARLCPQARALADMASVLGRYRDLGTLLAVSGLDEDTLFNRLDELIERQFMLKEGEFYTFPHDRVRETLYDGLDPGRRQRLHQRAGEAIEAAHADDLAPVVHELARHFSRGQDLEKAYRYQQAAGDQAERGMADHIAIDYWVGADAALEKLDLPDKHLLQARLWLQIGQMGFVLTPEIALRAFEKLIHGSENWPGGLPAEAEVDLRSVYAWTAITFGFLGQPVRSLDMADHAYRMTAMDDSPPALAATFVKCSGLITAGRTDEVIATAKYVTDKLEGLPPGENSPAVLGARVGSYGMQNACALQGVRPDPVLLAKANAAALLNQDENPFTPNIFFGYWPAATGRQAEAQAYIEATMQKCRKIGAAPYQWVLLLRPYLLWQRGELAQARAQVDLSLAYPHMSQNMLAMHHLTALEAQITLEEGDWAGAAGKLAQLEATARETGMQLSLMLALLVKAELSRVCRAFGAARLAAQEVHTLASSGPTRNPLMQGRAALLLGRLAIVQTDWPLAERYLNEAYAIASRPEQDNLIEQAHALLALGELNAGKGDRTAATASLRQAGELYHQLKNSHWLHAVTQRLEALHQDIRQASATVEASPEARWQFMSGMMR